jgi:hypothetical protein
MYEVFFGTFLDWDFVYIVSTYLSGRENPRGVCEMVVMRGGKGAVFWWVSRDMGVEMTCSGADMENPGTGTQERAESLICGGWSAPCARLRRG